MARKFRERKARATLSHMAEVWLRLAQRLQQQEQTSAQDRQRSSRTRRPVSQAVLHTNEGNRIESKQCLELALSGGKGMSAFAPLVFLTRVSRSTAQQPATSGVAMLVPASKKNAGSDEVPNTLLGVAARERVDRMPVPGATMSGLIRRSLRSEEHTSELQSLRHLVCRL